MKKFMLLFEQINKPDVKTQQKRGGEWAFGNIIFCSFNFKTL